LSCVLNVIYIYIVPWTIAVSFHAIIAQNSVKHFLMLLNNILLKKVFKGNSPVPNVHTMYLLLQLQ